jgi:hypothetical protein
MNWIAALIRLYPREYRARHGAELMAAMRAVAERERAAGASLPIIVVRLVTDAATSAFLVRRDACRACRSYLSHSSQPRNGDSIMQSLLYDARYALRMLVRSRWRSAPTLRSSASSTVCCCGRCRITIPIGWSSSTRESPG